MPPRRFQQPLRRRVLTILPAVGVAGPPPAERLYCTGKQQDERKLADDLPGVHDDREFTAEHPRQEFRRLNGDERHDEGDSSPSVSYLFVRITWHTHEVTFPPLANVIAAAAIDGPHATGAVSPIPERCSDATTTRTWR